MPIDITELMKQVGRIPILASHFIYGHVADTVNSVLRAKQKVAFFVSFAKQKGKILISRTAMSCRQDKNALFLSYTQDSLATYHLLLITSYLCR